MICSDNHASFKHFHCVFYIIGRYMHTVLFKMHSFDVVKQLIVSDSLFLFTSHESTQLCLYRSPIVTFAFVFHQPDLWLPARYSYVGRRIHVSLGWHINEMELHCLDSHVSDRLHVFAVIKLQKQKFIIIGSTQKNDNIIFVLLFVHERKRRFTC